MLRPCHLVIAVCLAHREEHRCEGSHIPTFLGVERLGSEICMAREPERPDEVRSVRPAAAQGPSAQHPARSLPPHQGTLQAARAELPQDPCHGSRHVPVSPAGPAPPAPHGCLHVMHRCTSRRASFPVAALRSMLWRVAPPSSPTRPVVTPAPHLSGRRCHSLFLQPLLWHRAPLPGGTVHQAADVHIRVAVTGIGRLPAGVLLGGRMPRPGLGASCFWEDGCPGQASGLMLSHPVGHFPGSCAASWFLQQRGRPAAWQPCPTWHLQSFLSQPRVVLLLPPLRAP